MRLLMALALALTLAGCNISASSQGLGGGYSLVTERDLDVHFIEGPGPQLCCVSQVTTLTGGQWDHRLRLAGCEGGRYSLQQPRATQPVCRRSTL